MTRQKRQDYTFRRQINEVPDNIPGCPNLLTSLSKTSGQGLSFRLTITVGGADLACSSNSGSAELDMQGKVSDHSGGLLQLWQHFEGEISQQGVQKQQHRGGLLDPLCI